MDNQYLCITTLTRCLYMYGYMAENMRRERKVIHRKKTTEFIQMSHIAFCNTIWSDSISQIVHTVSHTKSYLGLYFSISWITIPCTIFIGFLENKVKFHRYNFVLFFWAFWKMIFSIYILLFPPPPTHIHFLCLFFASTYPHFPPNS